MTIFKLIKKNKLSEYFSAPFWDGQSFDYKEPFFVNLHENASKQEESIILMYMANFEKFFLVYICPVLLLWKKVLNKTNPNITLGLLLFKFLKKKISEFLVILSERSFNELAGKWFKTTEKHSLAVCGKFSGQK